MATLDWNDNVVDSRDVQDRIDELEDTEVRDEDEQTELEHLREFKEEAANYASDWAWGISFIRDDYFEQYAQELAEDVGAVDPKASWPNIYIDWEAAADALKQDYSSIEFHGVEYWYRL